MTFDVEDPSLSGALRGYIDIRDGSNLVKPNYPETAEGRVYKGIPYYEKQLNEFVKAYTEEFNKLQMKGVKGTAEGLDGTSTADIPFFTIKDMTTDEIIQAIVDANQAASKDKVTSDQIIKYISQNITAGNACVNPDIIANNDLMAAATQVTDGVDGNDVALAMNDLRNQKIFKGRIAEDAIKSLVAVSSVNASAAKSAQTNFNNNSKVSREYNEFKPQEEHFNFVSEKKPVKMEEKPGCFDCTLVDLPFGHNGSQLDYDEASGTYLYSEYGGEHRDPGNGNQQLAFKNVILQKMGFNQLDAHGYMVWNCLDAGQEGYYITNGKAIPITWSKTSDTERTVYYDTEGNEIQVNTGKTYIGFVADTRWSELVVQ